MYCFVGNCECRNWAVRYGIRQFGQQQSYRCDLCRNDGTLPYGVEKIVETHGVTSMATLCHCYNQV